MLNPVSHSNHSLSLPRVSLAKSLSAFILWTWSSMATIPRGPSSVYMVKGQGEKGPGFSLCAAHHPGCDDCLWPLAFAYIRKGTVYPFQHREHGKKEGERETLLSCGVGGCQEFWPWHCVASLLEYVSVYTYLFIWMVMELFGNNAIIVVLDSIMFCCVSMTVTQVIVCIF